MDDPDERMDDARSCTVAGWIGSENLGDELVFSALADQLRTRGLEPTALSIDPERTRLDHDVAAVRRRRAVRSLGSRATVLGGGGLLQDETSTLNLDLHLMPVVAARLRREAVVGVGLGAGRLSTRSGQWRVRRVLSAVPLAVRDHASADLLQEIGLPRPEVAADLTLSLPSPDGGPQDRIVVALRPWSAKRHHVPARFRRHRVDPAFVEGTARSLDALVDATGMPIHLVTFDAPKDGPLHAAVAERMRHTPSISSPTFSDVLAEVAASRLVVSMRYHGGMAAVLGGRPAVLVGYSSKVDSLAADIGPGAVGLRFDEAGLGDLTGAATRVLEHSDAVVEGRQRLREREQNNGRLLDRLGEMLDE